MASQGHKKGGPRAENLSPVTKEGSFERRCTASAVISTFAPFEWLCEA